MQIKKVDANQKSIVAALRKAGATVEIKPLSVNECWQGKRFKTKTYKDYETSLLLMLPKITLPAAPFELCLKFGFSNSASDWDNPIKPLQDILQKKYGFNDRDVHKANVEKIKVAKGKEFIEFEIKSYICRAVQL